MMLLVSQSESSVESSSESRKPSVQEVRNSQSRPSNCFIVYEKKRRKNVTVKLLFKSLKIVYLAHT